MEEQKLVLQDGTYKYDDHTRQVSVSEEQLKKAGYVKLAGDEQIVKKVELSEEEAEFVEEYKDLIFSRPRSLDFNSKASEYATNHTPTYKEECMMLTRLIKAYYNGYTVKKEPKYYIKFPFDRVPTYLNVNKVDSSWKIDDKRQTEVFQTQFTLKEVDELQSNDQAIGLNLNALTVKVPDSELED